MESRHSRLAAVSPWDQGAPVIQGPDIYGASPGNPFLYAVPVTGERPLTFRAEGLPEGLQIDSASGHITGIASAEGDFPVQVIVENRHGACETELIIALGRGLALTPPMGWNSWNAWLRWVDDARVRAAADGLVKTGLAARGYAYVNIDSCWQGVRGGPHNAIQSNCKFPDMGALGAFIHERGLKFGIYSSPWITPWGCSDEEAIADWGGPGLIGCSSGEPDPDYVPQSIPEGRYVGLEKHEHEDVAQWMDWGVDYLKYDWFPNDPQCLERMGRLLKSAPRDVIFSICTEARLNLVEAYKTWAQMWRGIPDTSDSWPSIVKNAFMSDDYLGEDWRPHVSPGAWHDLDMLALGPQWHSSSGSRPNRLAEEEQITNMTAWMLYPSPILLSCDLEHLNDFELRLFGNEEVIAMNQDRLGAPAVRLYEERRQSPDGTRPARNLRVWARPLFDGRFALGFFNLADQPDDFAFDLKLLGLTQRVAVRNLWERRDMDPAHEQLMITVPAHGAQLVTVRP